MKMGTGLRAAAFIGIAAISVVAFGGPLASNAGAASFTSAPPATTTNGAGPFTWSFRSDAQPESAYSWVAYKLSTESSWHRCTPTEVVSLEDLPVGTYSIEISDDLNSWNWAGRGLGATANQECHEAEPPPGFIRRASSFSVIAPPPVVTPPPTVAPSQPTTTAPTTTPPTTSPTTVAPTVTPSCKRVARERGRLVVAIRVDSRRLKHSESVMEERAWRKRLAADKSRLRSLKCPS